MSDQVPANWFRPVDEVDLEWNNKPASKQGEGVMGIYISGELEGVEHVNNGFASIFTHHASHWTVSVWGVVGDPSKRPVLDQALYNVVEQHKRYFTTHNDVYTFKWIVLEAIPRGTTITAASTVDIRVHRANTRHSLPSLPSLTRLTRFMQS